MEFPVTNIIFMLLLAGGMFYGQSVFKRKRAEWGKTLTIGCAISIILLTIWTNLREPNYGKMSEIEKQYQAVQATVLAHNLANMYSGKGKCLVIHEPLLNKGSKEHVERMLAAFKNGFQNRVSEIRAVPIKPFMAGDDSIPEEMLMENKAEDFNKIIQANKDCDMLILLVPLPVSEADLFEMDPFLMIEDPDNPGGWIKDPKKDYPLVGVFNGFIGNSESLFHDKLLGAMSMWRPNSTIDEQPVPDDIQEAFNKRYIVVTKENISDVKEKYPKLFPKRN